VCVFVCGSSSVHKHLKECNTKHHSIIMSTMNDTKQNTTAGNKLPFYAVS